MSFDTKDKIKIYTDGSCSGNPGPGGWASVIVDVDGVETILSGHDSNTTNNRMELTGVLSALRHIGNVNTPVDTSIVLFSDSQYVVNGVKWAMGWRKNKWIKSDGKPALNADLWAEILSLTDKLNIEFVWVKGHAGNKYNELCDSLAVTETQKAQNCVSQTEPNASTANDNEPITTGERARMIFDSFSADIQNKLIDLYLSDDDSLLIKRIESLEIPGLTDSTVNAMLTIIGLRALKRTVLKLQSLD